MSRADIVLLLGFTESTNLESGQNRISEDFFNSRARSFRHSRFSLSSVLLRIFFFASVIVDSLEIYKANEWRETFQSTL